MNLKFGFSKEAELTKSASCFDIYYASKINLKNLSVWGFLEKLSCTFKV